MSSASAPAATAVYVYGVVAGAVPAVSAAGVGERPAPVRAIPGDGAEPRGQEEEQPEEPEDEDQEEPEPEAEERPRRRSRRRATASSGRRT